MAAGALAVTALALTACFADPTTGGAPAESSGGLDVTPEIESIRELVPDELIEQGYIDVGYQNTAGLPYGEIGEDGQDRGLSVDLANKLGEVFGLEVRGNGVDFAQLIPGLEAGRYDLVTNITTDTPDRREIVDYVDVMFGEPSSLVVLAESEHQGIELSEACGLTVGVDTGSSQEEQVNEASDACVEAGDSAIEVQAFQGIPDMILALKSGRSDAVFLSMGASRYTASQDESLALSTTGTELVELNGVLTPKDDGLKEAVRAAMLYLLESGEWPAMLDEYGLGDLAPTPEVINNDEADYTALLEAAQAEREG